MSNKKINIGGETITEEEFEKASMEALGNFGISDQLWNSSLHPIFLRHHGFFYTLYYLGLIP